MVVGVVGSGVGLVELDGLGEERERVKLLVARVLELRESFK